MPTKLLQDRALSWFKRLPKLDAPWDEDIVCKAFVVLPCSDLHDSGYRCMEFVPVDAKGIPLGRLSGGTDSVNLEGAGGDEMEDVDGKAYCRYARLVPPRGWSVDCLPGSNLLHFWCSGCDIVFKRRHSSLDIISRQRKEGVQP